jgi:hypothetical protein
MAITPRSRVGIYAAALTGVVVVVGDLICVWGSTETSTATLTVSDNAAGGTNAYSTAVTQTSSGGSTAIGKLFYAVAKASETLTITLGGTGTDLGISVHVVDMGGSISVGTVLDQASGQQTAGTNTQDTPNITTTVADEYLMSAFFEEQAGSTQTENAQSFTKRTEENGHVHTTLDRIVSATGTYHDSVTSTSAVIFGAVIASFKMPSGGGGGDLSALIGEPICGAGVIN